MAFKMIDVPFESKAGWVLRLDVDHTQKVNIGGQGQSPKEQRFFKISLPQQSPLCHRSSPLYHRSRMSHIGLPSKS